MGAEGHEIGFLERTGEPLALKPIAFEDAAPLAAALAAMLPWSVYPYPAEGIRHYLVTEEPGAPRYALTIGGTTAGVAGLRLGWLRGPYLQMLAVLPAFQGHGAGRRVLDWMEREARLRGERNLWVCASEFNDGALRFYERAGFTRVAPLDGLVSDRIAEILMRKRLNI